MYVVLKCSGRPLNLIIEWLSSQYELFSSFGIWHPSGLRIQRPIWYRISGEVMRALWLEVVSSVITWKEKTSHRPTLLQSPCLGFRPRRSRDLEVHDSARWKSMYVGLRSLSFVNPWIGSVLTGVADLVGIEMSTDILPAASLAAWVYTSIFKHRCSLSRAQWAWVAGNHDVWGSSFDYGELHLRTLVEDQSESAVRILHIALFESSARDYDVHSIQAVRAGE